MASRIIFVTDAQSRAGAENYLISLLSFRGIPKDVVIIVDQLTPESVVVDLQKLGIQVVSKWRFRRYNILSFMGLWWYFIRHRAVIVCNMTHWESCTWARLAIILSGQRYGQVFHMLNPIPQHRSLLRRLKDQLSYFIASFSEFIIAPSVFMKQLLVNDRGVSKVKIEVIYNGVQDANSTKNSIARAKTEHKLTLLSLGRLEPVKGHKYLIEALTILPVAIQNSIELAIAGEGSIRDELESSIRESKLESVIELPGYKNDVSSLLAEADIFILPSVEENFPLTVLEAMAAGLPVVASDVGGVSEQVVDKETGLLVKPGDPGSIANALLQLINNEELRISLGVAGRKRYEDTFKLEVMQQQTWSFLLHQLKRSFND